MDPDAGVSKWPQRTTTDTIWATGPGRYRAPPPRQEGQWGGVAEDNRRFADAVPWVLRTGAPGATCRPTTAGGRTRTDVSADGGTGASGSGCPGSWPASPTPGGSWRARSTPRRATTARGRRAGAGAWVAQKGVRHEDTPGVDAPDMPAGFLVTPGALADRGSAVEPVRGFDADALRSRRACDTDEALAVRWARHGGARPAEV